MKTIYLIPLFLFIGVSGISQPSGIEITSSLTNPYSNIHPFITLDTISKAKTLKDLHNRFPDKWISEYLSVEMRTDCGGSTMTAFGPNEILTENQKDILELAGDRCDIEIIIDYLPANNLKDNPPKKLNFTLTKASLYEAKYPGGQKELKAYLEKNTLQKISEEVFDQIEMAEIRFTINQEGKTSNIEVVSSSKNEEIDKLIIQALSEMPIWAPAINSKGIRINQEFEFRLGTDLYRCDYGIIQRQKRGLSTSH